MTIVSDQTSNLEAALYYASLGYRVIPIHGFINGVCSCCHTPCPQNSKPGKHPATPHGCKDGTTDEAQIKAWFSGKPWLNVGIALDENTLGLDEDPAKGGSESMKAWEAEHGPLSQGPTVRTGTDGRHKYRLLPPGVVVKNKAGWAPGIDTRSLGGYLVAPPSLHESGQRYEWLEPLVKPEALPLAPEWLLNIVGEATPKPSPMLAAKPRASGMGQSIAFGPVRDDGAIDFSSHPGAPEGERNQELCRLTGIHLSRGDSLKSIEAMAVKWGEQCSPPCKPKGIVEKVRALAKADARKRGVGVDRMEGRGVGIVDEALGHKDGRTEGHKPLALGETSDLMTLRPYDHDPNTEAGSLGGEAAITNPHPPNLSTYVLKLTKNTLANGPLPPVGGREGYAFSQEPKAEGESKGFGFGVVVEDGAPEGGDGALGFEPIVIAQCEPRARGFAASGSDSEGDEREPQSDWPILGQEAYHGLLGDIVKAIEPETEADGVGILMTLLTAFGNAVGRGPYFAAGADTHHANLFLAIVGNTASRKGMSLGVAKYLMQKAEPEWYGKHLGHGLSSGEGLIQRVADDEVNPEGQGFFGFAIPEAKRLFDIETEFVKLLQVKGREGNTLNANIRNAWDGSPLETMIVTKGGETAKSKPRHKATNHHISILGHITPKELQKAMGGSVDMSNGFCNRFLWALVKRARYLPDGGDISVLDHFIKPMQEAIATAKGIGRVVRDNEAKALWHHVYRGLSSADEESSGRAEAQTLRLSLLYALADGSPIVNASHLRAALSVWRYCEHSARIIFGGQSKEVTGEGRGMEAKEEPLDFRLLMAIEKNPGIHRRDLRRACRKATNEEFDEALASLDARGLAHKRPVATGGRTAEGWFPGREPDGPDDGDEGDDEGIKGRGEAATPQAPPFFGPVAHDDGLVVWSEGHKVASPDPQTYDLPSLRPCDQATDEKGMSLFQWYANRIAEKLGIPAPDIDGAADDEGESESQEAHGPLPEPLLPSSVHSEATPVPLATALNEAEFFSELTDEPTLKDEAYDFLKEGDDMSMQDFEGYLRTNLGRENNYREPERLSYAEKLVVRHAQADAIAKAKERKYRREHPEEFMSEDEFEKALDEALMLA